VAKVVEYCVDRQAWENNSGAMTVLYVTDDLPETVQVAGYFPGDHFAYSDFFKGAETMNRHDFRTKHKFWSM
jgi:hypothetical protein